VGKGAQKWAKVRKSGQRCAKVGKGVQRCAKVGKGVQRCAKVCKGAQRCAKVCKGAQKCAKVRKSVQKCAKVCKIVQKCVFATKLVDTPSAKVAQPANPIQHKYPSPAALLPFFFFSPHTYLGAIAVAPKSSRSKDYHLHSTAKAVVFAKSFRAFWYWNF
jgi:hypothetical protein